MDRRLEKIIIYIIILNLTTILTYAKGTLSVNATIQPYGTTKKYNYNSSLLLDAGILNSNSNVSELKLGTVTVDMRAEQTGNDPGIQLGISGDFNQTFSLSKVQTPKDVVLTTITKYKNAENANMELKIKNVQILVKTLLSNSPEVGDTYLFVAYPDELTNLPPGINAIQHLTYSFELWVQVSGVKAGDIIRRDVKTQEGTEAIGNIQDIIKEQFRNAK